MSVAGRSPGWPACSICRDYSSVIVTRGWFPQSETFKVIGAAAPARHHQSGHDRDLGAGALARVRERIFQSAWFHAKFALVIRDVGDHGFNARWVRAFATDRNVH